MIAVREAGVRAAQAALDQAMLNRGYTKIVAPASGIVGKKTVEVGQRVDPGQGLLALVALDDLWVDRQLQGDAAHAAWAPVSRQTIHVDSHRQGLHAARWRRSDARRQRFECFQPASRPRTRTGNYVKVVQRLPVRIRFNPGQDPDGRLRPGMSVEPTVWLR